MKELKKELFVRFGGLSSVPQKGYDQSMPTMHSPPARRGVYAFPASQIEKYLLGKEYFDQRRMVRVEEDEDLLQCRVMKNEKYVKKVEEIVDQKYNEQTSEEERERLSSEIDVLWEEGGIYFKHKRPKKFSYEGELWHHLYYNTKINECLQIKGFWCLTSYETWLRAFHKEVGKLRVSKATKGYGFSKDYFEVFIEKI